MPILRTVASGLLSRRAARRLSRAIPNPVVRMLAVAAATTLVPMAVNHVATRWQNRRRSRTAGDLAQA